LLATNQAIRNFAHHGNVVYSTPENLHARAKFIW
jgi:hypothetical protein